MINSGKRRTQSREFRIIVGLVGLTVIGTLAATTISSIRNGQASAGTQAQRVVRIEDVKPNAQRPAVLAEGSTGVFTVDCGTNGNKKFSPDNPVAQPGIKNGAEHVHDFVGNLSANADSTDESLDASGTTCKNGDKSSYFWPVVRVDKAQSGGTKAPAPAATGAPSISCPTVKDKLPAVPAPARDEVIRNLALLETQIAEANQRLVTSNGQGGADFVNNAILGPLRDKRVATIDRIAIAIGRTAAKPTNLAALAECELSFDAGHAGHHAAAPSTTASATTAAAPAGSAGEATPTVNCPTVRDKLPGIPDSAVAEVNRNLTLLDTQIGEANERLVTTQGQGGANFVDNAILGPLKDKRVATIDRIAIAIGRTAAKPTGLEALAPCALNNAGGNTGGKPAGSTVGLSAPQGANFELPGNAGVIQRPQSVKIEYRGNPTGKVVAMPKFLHALTGDAKPTSRGPANARAAWTCSGFEDRITDKYVICPSGSRVERVHDFAGCWDGKNTDSANHRTHVAFADPATGACKAGFVAIPQLRITIAYNISRDIQKAGLYAVDSFPEENHNPFSDHDDFINVNSAQTMAKIANCVNTGRRCS